MIEPVVVPPANVDTRQSIADRRALRMDELLDKIRRGDRRSLAQAMSLVDQPGRIDHELEDCLRQLTGDVPWWGFTGPPGVGKSTLIDALIGLLRQRGRRVGVVAVDPTSPLTNGALLGDRVRMMRHAVDDDVFIRSLATHGREGGLSDAALHCARLLELANFDPVLIETVGVGQNDVDIASVADVCVVVLAPGYGDDIQLIKAGLLEIADIVVVNKGDLPEANRLAKQVHEELGARSSDTREVRIVAVEAKSGKDVDQLLSELIEADRASCGESQRLHRQQRRLLGEIRRTATLRFEKTLEKRLAAPEGQELLAGLARGELTLDSVLTRLGLDGPCSGE
ncbi:MAG: methylmalonyl Co-A mutase-associated GTPase MeaB [Planctomycetes bacterium]|nr:methylmalonyl Co-A mutase-associated GTPase MeaB [Planctomycetota bacterium]